MAESEDELKSLLMKLKEGSENACNAGDLGSIPRSATYSGEVIGYSLLYAWASLVAQMVSACNVGDLGSIPGLERSPGEGEGCPLQYSGLQNSMDYTVHVVAKSQTQQSDFHFHLSFIYGCAGSSLL